LLTRGRVSSNQMYDEGWKNIVNIDVSAYLGLLLESSPWSRRDRPLTARLPSILSL
jgi:hypothetical protein